MDKSRCQTHQVSHFWTQPHPDNGNDNNGSGCETAYTSYPVLLACSRQETTCRHKCLAPEFPALGTNMLQWYYLPRCWLLLISVSSLDRLQCSFEGISIVDRWKLSFIHRMMLGICGYGHLLWHCTLYIRTFECKVSIWLAYQRPQLQSRPTTPGVDPCTSIYIGGCFKTLR